MRQEALFPLFRESFLTSAPSPKTGSPPNMVRAGQGWGKEVHLHPPNMAHRGKREGWGEGKPQICARPYRTSIMTT